MKQALQLTLEESLADMVDEFYELTQALSQKKERHEELKKILSDEANWHKDKNELTLKGHKHRIVFSGCSEVKTLEVTDPNLLLKLYGIEVFKPDLTKIDDFNKLHSNNKTFINKSKKLLGDKSALGWKWGSRRLLSRNI